MNRDFSKVELPMGWSWTTIDGVTKKVTDGSHNPPKKQENGIPMLSAKNITNNNISFDDVRFISQDNFTDELERVNIEPGDVLLTIVATIGRCAIVPESLTTKFAIQRSVALLKPALINGEYLMYACQSPFFQKLLESSAKGTAQKGVYLGMLKLLPIPLAPLQEQRLISLKIQEIFNDLAQAENSLLNAKNKLYVCKQAILKSAFEGNLTKEWRYNNKPTSAFEVLKSINKNRINSTKSDSEKKSKDTLRFSSRRVKK